MTAMTSGYQLCAPSGAGGWVAVEHPIPTPSLSQVVVRVHAVSLNYRDWILANNPKQRMPIVPCSDGVGEVVAAGAAVKRVRVGDRVAGCFFQNWIDGPTRADIHSSALGGAVDGMLSAHVVLEDEGVVKLPDNLSYRDAATLPCAAVTAWNGLFEQGNLQPGDSVLILGTGGVSIFALQLAHAAGAKCIVTSSSDSKLQRAKELGADLTINYQQHPDWHRIVWDATDKLGVDHVVEVGGAGTLEKSLQAVRYGGHIALTGVLTGFEGQINPIPILMRSLRVNGIYVGSRAMFERLLACMAQTRISPIIDRVFPFSQAPAALDYLSRGQHLGKIVIELS
jgi:NADPH:quinone reductase-like Zn-dependent oxidoreductase